MWRAASRALLDLLFAPHCAACGREAWEAAEPDALCLSCAARVEPLQARCERCGRRAGPLGGVRGCLRCAAEHWPVEGIVAGQSYRGVPRELVVALKFRARARAAQALARWLALSLEARALPGDLLVPVPLSHRRLATRGFNQAEVLARHVGAALHVPLDAQALQRTRHGPPQSAQRPGQRRRGARGAFTALPGRVQGRCVIVVDDVLTSGATALACAHALARAGAAAVVLAAACRSEGHPGARRQDELLARA
ncbi:MAG: ComF family protein [Planctomycetia bacterium]